MLLGCLKRRFSSGLREEIAYNQATVHCTVLIVGVVYAVLVLKRWLFPPAPKSKAE